MAKRKSQLTTDQVAYLVEQLDKNPKAGWIDAKMANGLAVKLKGVIRNYELRYIAIVIPVKLRVRGSERTTEGIDRMSLNVRTGVITDG